MASFGHVAVGLLTGRLHGGGGKGAGGGTLAEGAPKRRPISWVTLLVFTGLALLPESLVMFALSSIFGRLADRFGPRLFMGGGPLIAGAGMLLLLTFGVHVDYLTEVLPGILVFSLGLSITVAPLTAAILGWVWLGEALGPLQAVGGVIVLAGIMVARRANPSPLKITACASRWSEYG